MDSTRLPASGQGPPKKRSKEIFVLYYHVGSGRISSKQIPWREFVTLWQEKMLEFQYKKDEKDWDKPEHYPTLEEAIIFAKEDAEESELTSTHRTFASREREDRFLRELIKTPVKPYSPIGPIRVVRGIPQRPYVPAEREEVVPKKKPGPKKHKKRRPKAK